MLSLLSRSELAEFRRRRYDVFFDAVGSDWFSAIREAKQQAKRLHRSHRQTHDGFSQSLFQALHSDFASLYADVLNRCLDADAAQLAANQGLSFDDARAQVERMLDERVAAESKASAAAYAASRGTSKEKATRTGRFSTFGTAVKLNMTAAVVSVAAAFSLPGIINWWAKGDAAKAEQWETLAGILPFRLTDPHFAIAAVAIAVLAVLASLRTRLFPGHFPAGKRGWVGSFTAGSLTVANISAALLIALPALAAVALLAIIVAIAGIIFVAVTE